MDLGMDLEFSKAIHEWMSPYPFMNGYRKNLVG